MKLSNVTFGVNTVGNTKALLMCLASVLNAEVIPGAIQIRSEGSLPAFGDFYMEQLAELARFKGVDFSINVAKSAGIRAARDWQIDFCRTDYLWMGDDDVLYSYDCLNFLYDGMLRVGPLNGGGLKTPKNVAYVCGTKGDLNNRRGWANFEMSLKTVDDVKDNCSFNHFYDKETCMGSYAEIYTADTGNMLINLPLVRSKKIRFSLFDESTNSGGEDTLFAMECRHRGTSAYIIPSAQSYHLEKPMVNFGEAAARVEMVLRCAELRGYNPELIAKVKTALMPGTPRFKKV